MQYLQGQKHVAEEEGKGGGEAKLQACKGSSTCPVWNGLPVSSCATYTTLVDRFLGKELRLTVTCLVHDAC